MDEIKRKFDLEERLIDFATMIISTVETLPSTRAGSHLAINIHEKRFYGYSKQKTYLI
jgi:hypothetical protein